MSDPSLNGQTDPNYFSQSPPLAQQTYAPSKELDLTEKLASGYLEHRTQIAQGDAQPWGPDPLIKPTPKMPNTLKEWMIGSSIAGVALLTVLTTTTILTATLDTARSISIGWFLIMVPSVFKLNLSLLITHLKVGIAGGTLVGLISGPFMAALFAIGVGSHIIGFQERFPAVYERVTPPMKLRQAFWKTHSFATSAGAVYLGIEVLRWWHGGVIPEGSAALKVDPFWGAIYGGVGHLAWLAYRTFKGTAQPAAPVAPNQLGQTGVPVNTY